MLIHSWLFLLNMLLFSPLNLWLKLYFFLHLHSVCPYCGWCPLCFLSSCLDVASCPEYRGIAVEVAPVPLLLSLHQGAVNPHSLAPGLPSASACWAFLLPCPLQFNMLSQNGLFSWAGLGRMIVGALGGKGFQACSNRSSIQGLWLTPWWMGSPRGAAGVTGGGEFIVPWGIVGRWPDQSKAPLCVCACTWAYTCAHVKGRGGDEA